METNSLPPTRSSTTSRYFFSHDLLRVKGTKLCLMRHRTSQRNRFFFFLLSFPRIDPPVGVVLYPFLSKTSNFHFQLECEAERRWPLFVYSILIVYGVLLTITALWTWLVSKWKSTYNLCTLHRFTKKIFSFTECCKKIVGPRHVDPQLGSSKF